MKINFSKIEAAEIQLNEAIFLFFDNANPMVIETLIGAVIGVLRPLGKKYGIKAPIHDSDIIKSEFKNKWIKDYLHKAQNFCKHADNDQEASLFYETDTLPIHIFEACHLFRHLSSNKCLKYRQSKSAIMYELWFGLKYPKLLKDPVEFNKFLQTTGMPGNFKVDNFEMMRLIADTCRIKL
jgi:hypothetical protein